LDEQTIWRALNETNVRYEDWSARKEYEESWPVLRILLEPKEGVDAKAIEASLHERLRVMSALYEEAVIETERNPVKVTILNRGSFQSFNEDQQKAGADLAQLKPAHMNAPDTVIQHLLKCSDRPVE
ncbi:hypothetical protein ACFLWX_02375, partial [Chloroflexota bacterium]